MVQASPSQVEFSRLIPRSKLEDRSQTEGRLQIEAMPGERTALAKRFDLMSVDLLRASLRWQPERGEESIRLLGHLEAEVVQACVVTLEPVRGRIDERFELLFSLTARHEQEAEEVDFSVDEEDPPEPVGRAGIDAGEVVAQQLALFLDPYPRAEGARIDEAGWRGSSDGENMEDGPFGGLKRLKRRT